MKQTIYSVVCITASKNIINSYVVNSFTDEEAANHSRDMEFVQSYIIWSNEHEGSFVTDEEHHILYSKNESEQYKVVRNDLFVD